MRRYLRLLRRRDYALLWTGATISALGDGMSFVALVWLVLEQTDDPGMVGVVAAAYTAPVIVGGLVAGLLLDRYDRRRLLAIDNLLRGAAVASVPIAAAAGTLTTAHLVIVAAIYGFLFMISVAGIPSLLPSYVPEDELTTANAMETISYGIAGLAGPALAGVVIALVGAPVVLAFDALTYLIFAGCLLAMRPPPSAGPAVEDELGELAGGGLRPAFTFILRTPAILAITLMFMSVNVAESMMNVLLPIYATDVLLAGAATYGILASAFTAGILAGSLVVGAVGWRWPLGRSIAVAQTATGLALLLLLGPPALPLALFSLLLAGVFASSLTAWAQTIRMRLIPPEMRGRVFAVLRTLMNATAPIGALIGGALLAADNVTLVIALMVVVVVVPGAIGLVHPALGPCYTAEGRVQTVERGA
ncbi:MAG TPA: MFS transporter [Candidatus Limnocylindrales bacterium]|nr:MFS transporter [Candidatus Limnocylindrales bacterium]